MRLRSLLAGALLAAVVAVVGPASAAAPAIAVKGNHIVDATGHAVQLRGFAISGTEYACVQGSAVFTVHMDSATLSRMLQWHPNTIRIPLNEDCWLGINGVNPKYGGVNYRSAISAVVSRLSSLGIVTVLDLHWSAPGTKRATGQAVMADRDHSPAFWSSVARTFRDNRLVAFELFNEPHDISWACWRNGCTAHGFRIAGMQTLLNAVRRSGARNVVIANGLGWGNDVSGWLAHRPTDRAHQLVAGVHVYNYSPCRASSCWTRDYAAVASRVPVTATEFGQTGCVGHWVNTFMRWSDPHEIGYLAWAWNTGSCTRGTYLLADARGTPTSYGAAVKLHLTSRARSTGSR